MTRKTPFLTVLIALLVLVGGWSMAQNVRVADNPDDAADISPPGEPGDDDDNNTLTVLLNTTDTFDQVESPGGEGHGPFYIGGTLFDVDTGEELGDFQCWGWFFTPSRRMVTQEYNIGDAGTIIVAGEELVNKLAILGGTGDFQGAGGEMVFEFTDDGILVHFTFGGPDDDDDDDDD